MTIEIAQFPLTEIDIVYKNPVPFENRRTIGNPDDAHRLFIEAWDLNKIDLLEEFKVLHLDRKMTCLGISHHGKGSRGGVIIEPAHIFAMAFKTNTASLIVAHNHPSGSLKPSKADIALTEKLRYIGELVDVQLHDHLIITPLKYLSMREEGHI